MSAPTHAANLNRIEQDLAGDFVHVVEEAAISAARTMGQGDRAGSDQAAVQAMRHAFEEVQIAGKIVIGEGERDEAPMLYIGEKVGETPPKGVEYPQVDIAVDPLEGTNLCALGTANSIAVLAASEPGRAAACAGLLHGKDHRGSGVPRCAGYRRAGEIQPESDRALPGPAGEGPGDHGAGPSAA